MRPPRPTGTAWQRCEPLTGRHRGGRRDTARGSPDTGPAPFRRLRRPGGLRVPPAAHAQGRAARRAPVTADGPGGAGPCTPSSHGRPAGRRDPARAGRCTAGTRSAGRIPAPPRKRAGRTPPVSGDIPRRPGGSFGPGADGTTTTTRPRPAACPTGARSTRSTRRSRWRPGRRSADAAEGPRAAKGRTVPPRRPRRATAPRPGSTVLPRSRKRPRPRTAPQRAGPAAPAAPAARNPRARSRTAHRPDPCGGPLEGRYRTPLAENGPG